MAKQDTKATKLFYIGLALDSTKVQTLGAISESINETRHCTAASYTIRWDTGPRGVYLSTEQVSRRLAASASKPDCTSTFPTLRWAASGQRQVKEASGGQRYIGSGREQQGGARPRTRMLTPLIDGLGRATWSLTMPVTRSRTP